MRTATHISKGEFEERIKSTTRAMVNEGLDALIIVLSSDIRYLSNYHPLVAGDSHIEGAAMILSEREEPSLIIDFSPDMPRARSTSVVSDVEFSSSLAGGISRMLSDAKVHGRVGVVGWGIFPTPAYLTLRRDHPDLELHAADELMRDLRMKKSPAEIKLLKMALKISEVALGKARERMKPGVTESELGNIIDSTIKSLGAEEFAFPTIVISGLRTNLMIDYPGRRKVGQGDPVLIDLGARIEGYCADLSRTFICGQPTRAQKEVVEAVHAMYSEMIKRARPGEGANDLHEVAKRVAKELGFGANVQHLAGHGVGVDVHEKPLFDIENTPLARSTIDALEPGLYVKGVGGFIVENTILVTQTGNEVLNRTDLGP